MKKILLTIAATALLLGRCTPATMPDMTPENKKTAISANEENGYVPLNFQYQKGLWLPYTNYEELLKGKSEKEFRKAVGERFRNAAEQGINTVYLHVRPDGYAYYDSDFFPRETLTDGSYDPLEVMLEEAHDSGLSAHAWVNPLRLQSVEQMENIPDSFAVKQLYNSGNADIAGGRLYFHPDSAEVQALLRDSTAEIVQKYNIDGIHIDDYFYPTTDEEFDAVRFAESGSNDLKQWRTEAISDMVKAMYDGTKAADGDVLFGISPQGNLRADYESQYADVKRWLSEDGFCDYMIPQIYYGFNNETLPFLPTLEEWTSLPKSKNVKLIIGLGAYKQGKEDKWAGAAGESEWLESDDVIARQIKAVEDSAADGYALYY